MFFVIYLHRTVKATEADLIRGCPLMAQWYLPASSLLAWKTSLKAGCPSLNQTTWSDVGQPDMQVSLTVPPSVTSLGRMMVFKSDPERGTGNVIIFMLTHFSHEECFYDFSVTFYRQQRE